MKTSQIAIAIIMLIVVALACCPSPGGVEVRPVEGGEQEEQEDQQEQESAVGTSRSNPAPPGSEVAVGDLAFSISSVVRPADDIVAEANALNDEPAEGSEYLIVEISIACNRGADEKCTISPGPEFELVGSSGVAREPEFVAGVEGRLGKSEISGGYTVLGKLVFQAGKGETDLILVYTESIGMDEAYLALP